MRRADCGLKAVLREVAVHQDSAVIGYEYDDFTFIPQRADISADDLENLGRFGVPANSKMIRLKELPDEQHVFGHCPLRRHRDKLEGAEVTARGHHRGVFEEQAVEVHRPLDAGDHPQLAEDGGLVDREVDELLGVLRLCQPGGRAGVELRLEEVYELLVGHGRLRPSGPLLWSVPLAALLALLSRPLAASAWGLTAAIVSGAVTSGLGYAIWYRALRGLTATRAAIVQVSVPVIAALAAVALLGETLDARLLLSGMAVLSGIVLVLTGRARAG